MLVAYIIGGVAVLFLALLVYLSATEYRPDPVAAVACEREAGTIPAPGDALSILTFNIGYGGLGAQSDFFMDGGRDVRPESPDIVEKNLAGIRSILDGAGKAQIYLLQEVDTASKRSYGKDEAAYLRQGRQMDAAYALNYSCKYVPYPLPCIGAVQSGLYTMSSYSFCQEEAAARLSLPNPFSWPVRLANLKRCLLVTRLELAGTERQLVLVNLHLEAYDDGNGKAAQTEMLMNFLGAEYEKGNYVIAGGDFNCSFPVVDPGAWPIMEAGNYVPGVMEPDALPAGFQWAVDGNTPTCRLLNKPLDAPGVNQFYVIDGFILSPNVELLQVETLDCGFLYSDHNPVLAQVRLREEQ